MDNESPTMEFTGERMVPEKADPDTFWEHVYRYKFALPYSVGKDVLDIASGEGYGAYALGLAGAKSVLGVDVSEEAVNHAIEKYGINALCGSAEDIPVKDDSIDLVVSFETIEHVEQPPVFIEECARVLRKGGGLLISTPNIDVYGVNYDNPYHCSEMTKDEFVELLSRYFEIKTFYTQLPTYSNLLSPRWFSATKRVSLGGIRGMGWARRKLARLMCPEIHGGLEDDKRNSVDQIITRGGEKLGSVFNPYLVRREPWFVDDRPRYFVAVAERK